MASGVSCTTVIYNVQFNLLSSGRLPRPGARAPRAAGPRAAQTLELHVRTLIVFTVHSGKFTAGLLTHTLLSVLTRATGDKL